MRLRRRATALEPRPGRDRLGGGRADRSRLGAGGKDARPLRSRPSARAQPRPGSRRWVHAATVDLDRLAEQLRQHGPYAVTKQVAGLGDLLAMKLNAIAGRGQLRDYFDLMTIDEQGGRTIEEGLGLFLARYQPRHEDSALIPVLLALGHLEDVADDPFLPAKRETIVRYWQRRQPELVAAVDRYGISAPSAPRHTNDPHGRAHRA